MESSIGTVVATTATAIPSILTILFFAIFAFGLVL